MSRKFPNAPNEPTNYKRPPSPPEIPKVPETKYIKDFGEGNKTPPPKAPEPPKRRIVVDDDSKAKEMRRKNMGKNKTTGIVGLIVVICLVVCYMTYWAHKTSTPDCYSDLTKKAVSNIATKVFKNTISAAMGKELPDNVKYSVRDIRVQGQNKETESLLCAATFTAEANGGKLDNKIFFTIEKMEKFGEFYYTVTFGG